MVVVMQLFPMMMMVRKRHDNWDAAYLLNGRLDVEDGVDGLRGDDLPAAVGMDLPLPEQGEAVGKAHRHAQVMDDHHHH